MTRFLASLLVLGALSSCASKDEAAQVTQQRDTTTQVPRPPKAPIHIEPRPFPGGMEFETTYQQSVVDSLLRLPISERPQTPKAAAEYYLTIPPKLGIAPPTVPAKNIRVESENDTTAIIAYEAEHNPVSAKLVLYKASNGMNHVWLVRSTTMTHIH